jgi:hypothetical protein
MAIRAAKPFAAAVGAERPARLLVVQAQRRHHPGRRHAHRLDVVALQHGDGGAERDDGGGGDAAWLFAASGHSLPSLFPLVLAKAGTQVFYAIR